MGKHYSKKRHVVKKPEMVECTIINNLPHPLAGHSAMIIGNDVFLDGKFIGKKSE